MQLVFFCDWMIGRRFLGGCMVSLWLIGWVLPDCGEASTFATTKIQETTDQASRVLQPLGRGSVGQMIRIDSVVIPGSEVEVAPIDDGTDVVIRIRKVWPHGTDQRYDLEVQGRVAGVHDLAQYFRRKDGSSLEVTGLPFEVQDLITQDAAKPHAPPQAKLRPIGGYGRWATTIATVWVIAGLGLIIWVFRRPQQATDSSHARRTLAEQLEDAMQSVLSGSAERRDWARVESLLLAHWRNRMGLEAVSSAEALQRLRRDPQAGEVLRKLDEALHAPEPKDSIDWSALLKPYRDAAGVSAERLAAEERTR